MTVSYILVYLLCPQGLPKFKTQTSFNSYFIYTFYDMNYNNDLMLWGDIILSLRIKFTTYDMDMYKFLLEDVNLYSLVLLLCVPRGHTSSKFKPALIHISYVFFMTSDNDLMLKCNIILSIGIKFTTYDMEIYIIFYCKMWLYGLHAHEYSHSYD